MVAEQQPDVDELKDFKNRHYQIDQPREVTLPSVYASYDASQETPETLNSFYNYGRADPCSSWNRNIRSGLVRRTIRSRP